jgi:hypothetical protein
VRRQRWFKSIRLALICFALLEVSYVVGVNAFLNFGGTEKVLSATDDVRVTYRLAWSWWPGRVHVEDARMLFHDHNLEWSLDADWLVIDMKPLALLSKTFRASRVRGEGAVFRMRHRVFAKDATLPSTRALPPIPEFETPALFPAWVPTAARTDLWRIHAEDVDVGVVEIWAQQVRYLGHGRARGAFRLHAGHHLWVGPASLDLEPGELRAGNRQLARRFHGHVDCVVHPFFVNVPVGREVFRHISANIDVHGEDVSLAPLDLFLPSGTSLRSPGARLDLTLGADHGVITASSRLRLHGPDLDGRFSGVWFQAGAFELRGGTAPDGLGEARFRIEHARGARSERGRFTLGSGHTALATTSLDTSGEWSLARVDLAVSQFDVPELAGFDDLVRARRLRLDAGSASVDASGRYSGGSVSGEGRARLSGARGRVASVGWALDGSASVSLGRARTEASSLDRLDASIEARRLALVSGKFSLAATDARVSAFARLSDGRGSGRVRTQVRHGSLAIGAVRVDGSASVDVQLPRIDLPARAYTAATTGEIGSFEAVFGGAARGKGQRLGFESELSVSRNELARAWVQASTKQLSVRTGGSAIFTSVDLYAEAKQLDLEHRSGTARATLLVRDFSSIDAVAGARCQWLSMPRAVVKSQLAFSPRHEARASVFAELDAVRARWDDFEVAGSVELESRFHQGDGDRLTLDVVAKQVSMKSGSGPGEGWEARIPKFRMASALRWDLAQLSGDVRTRASGLEGRIGRTQVHGDLASDWRVSLLDLARSEAIVTGDVRIDAAGLEAPGLNVDGWWARVHVPTLSLSAKENLDLTGDFSAKFRDALPALGMFAASGDLPDWVPTMFPLRELEAKGSFSRRCRTTDIAIETARGGPLAAAGRIQSVPSDTRGAFLVRLRSPLAVSLGLVTYQDDVELAFLAGNDWLRQQSEILDQWALVTRCKPAVEACKLDR